MDVGTAFLFPSGSRGFHLTIVCTPEADPPDMRLLVNITSIKENKFHDQTCIVGESDHPFLKHDSYVAYKHADSRSSAAIRKCLSSGQFIQQEAIGQDVMERVLAGFHESIFTSPWVLDHL